MSDWSVCYFKRALYSCERARSAHIETKQLYYSYESHVRLICILLGKSPIFIRKKPIFIRKERALYLHERSQYSYEKKEPYIHTKEAYIHTKEPYVHISCKTHPCITTVKELYISAKEPYTYILNQIDLMPMGSHEPHVKLTCMLPQKSRYTPAEEPYITLKEFCVYIMNLIEMDTQIQS